MMTDQELLEYAAKAVELVNPRYVANTSWGTGISHGDGDEAYVVWNSLLSDADAFRLAAHLRFAIDMGGINTLSQQVYVGGAEGYLSSEDIGEDILKATRRAIVRAAAEIGRNMTE